MYLIIAKYLHQKVTIVQRISDNSYQLGRFCELSSQKFTTKSLELKQWLVQRQLELVEHQPLHNL
jgi:hypothetical protein